MAPALVGAADSSPPGGAAVLTRSVMPLWRFFVRSPVTLRVVVMLLFLVCVEVIGRNRLLGPSAVVSFSEMLSGLFDLARGGVVAQNTRITLSGVSRACAWAIPLGLMTGVLMWQRPLLGKVLEPYLVAAWTVPWFFFYPAMLSIFGLGSIPVVIVAGIMMLIPVTVATYQSLKSVPRTYFKVAKSCHFKMRARWHKIIVPAVVPELFAGIRIALVWGLAATVAMEFIASTGGLGFVVKTRLEWYQPQEMYGGILVIAALGLLVAFSMRWVESRIRRELA